MNPTGYGYVKMRVATGVFKEVNAHRACYELKRGKVPDGLVLDHLCRVRRCLNPDHLEPVTRSENVRRGDCPAAVAASNKARGAAITHCVHGHKYTKENTVRTKEGRRRCKSCWKAGFKKYNDAKALRMKIQANSPHF